MSRTSFLDALADGVMVGDGAMGTELYNRGIPLTANFDELNLTRPEVVRSVHADYVRAGARLLESNTYGANRGRLERAGLAGQLREINAAGIGLARSAAGPDVFVAGSIGSLPTGDTADEEGFSLSDAAEIFREQAEFLAEAGADVILLETFSDLDQLQAGVAAVRAHVDLPIIAQLTFQHRAVTSGGVDVYSALNSLVKLGADVVGTNCGRGVANVLHIIEEFTSQSTAPLSAFPNAGFPEDVGGRIMYLSSPQYFATMIEHMVDAGANLVGGCCGSSAQSIEAIVQRIGRRKPTARNIRAVPRASVSRPPVLPPVRTSYLDRVHRQKPVVFVELDPPFGLDFERLLAGCRTLHKLGVDAITMGDSPLATLRVSNIAAAALVQREVGIECITHLTCRDHNIIGLQALLMGAWVEGIKSVLIITGDPAKLGNQPGASSVYDLNSIGLIKIAGNLNRGINYAGASIRKATGFTIGCGFNPNFKNLKFEVAKLQRKVESGAQYALTQLTFDPQRFADAVSLIREEGMDIPIFPAIFPFMSARNAEFLHNELPGVRVPQPLLDRMAKCPPANAQAEGLQIAKELIEQYWDHADGLYIVPPFNRYELAVELVEHIHHHAAELHSGSGI